METEQTQNDFLGNAKLGKLMLKFCIPCILSLLVSALYNIVDQLFVGQNIGLSGLSVNGEALTASGIVFPIFIIAQAFAWWIGDGTAAYLNICQGRGQADKAHKAIGFGIALTVVISGVLMAIFYPLKEKILWLFGAEEEKVLEYAVQYFDIILGFFPVFMAMNMINAVIRADGAPGWSMASMLSGAIINIILDPIFLYVAKWGLAGAAWATVIGQCVSCVISVVYLFRTKTFKLKAKSFLPSGEIVPAIKLGLSSFITQMTIVVISLVCSRMLAKYGILKYGNAYMPVALIGVESKVFTLVVNIVVGIILGCQPILSYNLGAKNYKRVRLCYLYVLLCTVAITLLFTVLFEACPDMFIRLFIDGKTLENDPTYMEFGKKLFRIFLMFVTFTCTIKMSSIFFQALGKPVFATVASLVRDIVCFVPLVCTLPIAMGIDGCIWAAPIADGIAIIVTAALTVLCFKDLNKRAKAEVAAEPEKVAAEEPEKAVEGEITEN
ncbi:MAG: MATE family efflux transporter [Roseburia sp.]|nr:MATE family efflux transporter [Roseburia sp.]